MGERELYVKRDRRGAYSKVEAALEWVFLPFTLITHQFATEIIKITFLLFD